jgi:hypothetical protein
MVRRPHIGVRNYRRSDDSRRIQRWNDARQVVLVYDLNGRIDGFPILRSYLINHSTEVGERSLNLGGYGCPDLGLTEEKYEEMKAAYCKTEAGKEDPFNEPGW